MVRPPWRQAAAAATASASEAAHAGELVDVAAHDVKVPVGHAGVTVGEDGRDRPGQAGVTQDLVLLDGQVGVGTISPSSQAVDFHRPGTPHPCARPQVRGHPLTLS